MNLTPRPLNRLLCAIFGVLIMVIGIHLLLISTISGYARWWRAFAGEVGQTSLQILRNTTLAGQKDSWLWILIAMGLIIIILLMIWWIAVQGRGRVNEYVNSYFQDDPVPGRIEITDAAVEQILRTILGKRTDIVSLSLTLWENTPTPGIRVKVQPRSGVAPAELGAQVALAVRETQELMGVSGPIVVHLAAGARARFARSERVQ
ncbi:hypothetical protein CQ018_16035 [Arthrobacter sp. MYb227]|uniref:hypothetical protein n=1 Tax=Arthrobacter sp. MYb227 TaxID=1848601 RepID=UPI000CFC718C|nr:hypothetical protein [Arthrobacter sp. MYb227]PQZ89055.1 hypothetical protein CQ018_16035 [Arthrobacter sp. MYb227]